MPDFSYDAMGGPASKAAAYGSFEDEPPLLEGALSVPLSWPSHVMKQLLCQPRNCPAWLHAAAAGAARGMHE
jgi:hypothetical protein